MVYFVDERFVGVLEPGEHAYWKVFRSHEFRLVAMEDEATVLPLPVQEAIPDSLCTRLEVQSHEVALLYMDGRFGRLLEPGRYFFPGACAFNLERPRRRQAEDGAGGPADRGQEQKRKSGNLNWKI